MAGGREPEVVTVGSSSTGREPALVEQAESPASAAATSSRRPTLVTPGMPLLDAVEVARFLMDTSLAFERLRADRQLKTIGGPVDLAIITRHDGFRWGQIFTSSLVALAHGTTQLAEVTLTATSPAVGREIGQLGLPRESTVVALLRHSQIVVPHADLVLRAGDEVIVLTATDSEPGVRAALVG